MPTRQTAAVKSGASKRITRLASQNSLASGQPKTAGKGNPTVELTDTVYLEPLRYDEPVPSHPAAVGKILAEAGFRGSKEITKIGNFRFKLTVIDKIDPSQLTKLNLAANNLALYTPQRQKETICFVTDVPLDFPDEELNTETTTDVPVVKVERILKRDERGGLKPTRNVKVTVKGKEVPRSVSIYGALFKPELYIFPVKQCSVCWKLGHTRKKCAGKAKCKTCGKSHDASEPCESPPCCVNCKQGHAANSSACPEREKRNQGRKRILSEMQLKRADPDRAYPQTQNRFEGLPDESDFPGLGESIPVQPLYTGAVPKRTPNTRREKSVASSPRERSSQPVQGKPRESYSVVVGGNGHRVTEIERIVAQLRQDVLRLCQGQRWLESLVEVQRNLCQRIQQQRTEIETDQLLIDVSMQLNRIIQNEKEVTPQNNTQNKNNGA